MDGRELAIAVAAFVALLALGWASWLVLVRRGRGGAGPRSGSAPPRAARPAVPRDLGHEGRPRWASPWLWVGVAAVFVVLGIFVSPGLFGGVIVVVPFVWWSRPRPPDLDPRSNGHSRRHDALGR